MGRGWDKLLSRRHQLLLRANYWYHTFLVLIKVWLTTSLLQILDRTHSIVGFFAVQVNFVTGDMGAFDGLFLELVWAGQSETLLTGDVSPFEVYWDIVKGHLSDVSGCWEKVFHVCWCWLKVYSVSGVGARVFLKFDFAGNVAITELLLHYVSSRRRFGQQAHLGWAESLSDLFNSLLNSLFQCLSFFYSVILAYIALLVRTLRIYKFELLLLILL